MMENQLSFIIPIFGGRLNPSDAQKEMIRRYLSLRPNVRVSFSTPSRNRSKSQNAYMWSVVYSMIATQTGHTPEELHEFFKAKFLPRQFITLADQEIECQKSSTELTTMQFEQYLEQVRAFAAQELRMSIPLPNEAM